MEQRPLGGADDFFIIEVRAAGRQDDIVKAERMRGAQDGAHVAGILDAVEQDAAGWGGQGAFRHTAQRGDAAAGYTVRELAHDRLAERAQRQVKGGTGLILQGEEQLDEPGAVRLFDQVHAFDQEQALAVAVLFLMQAAPLLYLWIVH